MADIDLTDVIAGLRVQLEWHQAREKRLGAEVEELRESVTGYAQWVKDLRAEVKFWKETHASAVEHYKAQDINELHHENGRLRVALEQIAAGNVERDDYTERRKAIARAALAEERRRG